MATKQKFITIDGNDAAVKIAYPLSEVISIYPITPSTSMAEISDAWAAKELKNLWGTVPTVMEMQSEGGAVAALHGAAQTGTLTTTFTASQGLLLMIPNMYKLAGELTSTVFHITARSLAAQALSIFGDHSDVMAARSTGFAMLCSPGVQEAHDFALISHAATLESRIPFMHFFDGFRVSHEIKKIAEIPEDVIRAMIDDNLVLEYKKRALDPEHPRMRGTAQNPDVYFQGRETVNSFYTKTPAIVEKYMDKFAKLTGRKYSLADYFGDPNAEKVIVIMGSGAKTVIETINFLNKKGDKLGVVQLNLYRPFPVEQFVNAIPKTTKKIAVLDRTKEPGAIGEPLYQDVINALAEAENLNKTPFKPGALKIIGGRYGLSSKEFTPAMVKAIFDELAKDQPKNHFTIGINDDVTHTSLNYDKKFITESEKGVRAIFYGLGSDGTVGANKNSIKIIGEGTDFYTQGYFVYDSKKSGSRTISHLRFGPEPIESPYLIQKASFVGCHQLQFLETLDVLEFADNNATFLLNCPYKPEETWEHLPCPIQRQILEKKINFYVIDAYHVARHTGMESRINTIMQTCFFAISGVLPKDEAIAKIKQAIEKTYKSKGEEVIKKNFAAVDETLANLHKVQVPGSVTPNACEFTPPVSGKAPDFVKEFTAQIISGKGDDLPVSAMPVDGTFPTATTQWEKRNVSLFISGWNPDLCIQCGACTMVCPHSIIRVKNASDETLKNAPEKFKRARLKGKGATPDQNFCLQVYHEDCTGCNLCNEVCPAKSKENPSVKAIMMVEKDPIMKQEQDNIAFFETLPYNDRTKIELETTKGTQYLQPLFEFSSACAGCGETPYLRLISQLFGDRMLVANATGCSSIYGGNLPATPWAVDENGRGPAWSNSLFEDNAEFGLGYRLSVDKNQELALEILAALSDKIGSDLINAVKQGTKENTEIGIAEQRKRITEIKSKLKKIDDPRARHLMVIADNLIPRSVWLVGGDGWAYDIGYGGLDHVISTGKNVNILVLDTEVYSNTGGQSSKATPRAAVAKFAASGKGTGRKDLGLIAQSYGNVYVAQTALANPMHVLKAIREAESYEGTSLIIAYSHCIAHGYNLKFAIDQQKLAIASGFWPLYRYNPLRRAEGKNPFQLDSLAPSIPVEKYAYNEPRFKMLAATNEEHAKTLMQKLQEDVNNKWKQYSELAKKED